MTEAKAAKKKPVAKKKVSRLRLRRRFPTGPRYTQLVVFHGKDIDEVIRLGNEFLLSIDDYDRGMLVPVFWQHGEWILQIEQRVKKEEVPAK